LGCCCCCCYCCCRCSARTREKNPVDGEQVIQDWGLVQVIAHPSSVPPVQARVRSVWKEGVKDQDDDAEGVCRPLGRNSISTRMVSYRRSQVEGGSELRFSWEKKGGEVDSGSSSSACGVCGLPRGWVWATLNTFISNQRRSLTRFQDSVVEFRPTMRCDDVLPCYIYRGCVDGVVCISAWFCRLN